MRALKVKQSKIIPDTWSKLLLAHQLPISNNLIALKHFMTVDSGTEGKKTARLSEERRLHVHELLKDRSRISNICFLPVENVVLWFLIGSYLYTRQCLLAVRSARDTLIAPHSRRLCE